MKIIKFSILVLLVIGNASTLVYTCLFNYLFKIVLNLNQSTFGFMLIRDYVNLSLDVPPWSIGEIFVQLLESCASDPSLELIPKVLL